MLNLTQSEECLNLNIIRPVDINPDTKLPVLLWIYGGGYRQGSSADPMWNMSYIVAQSVAQGQPILGLSINYRISFLGFPSSQEVVSAGVANLGIKDQRASLQWVQENIAFFGGDPSKVTIWVSISKSAIVHQCQPAIDLVEATRPTTMPCFSFLTENLN